MKMSRLIVGSEEENEEESNQTFWGLRHWEDGNRMDALRKRKAERGLNKLLGASWDALMFHLKGLTCW